MLNDLCGAALVACPVILIAWAALRRWTPRRDRHAAERLRRDYGADQWAQAWRPEPTADMLRLRRDLRPWLPKRRLP